MKNSKFFQGVVGFFANALEFYEFTIYGVFAGIFSERFFSNVDPYTGLIYSWLIFSIGFLFRPAGAFIFGYIGDKFGRKVALLSSITSMALATVGIGLLPDYAVLGSLAPLFLILMRMIQGLSTGGEYNGCAIYLIERMGQDRPGFIGGIVTSSCAIGALGGTLIGKVLLPLGGDYWRWGFILGGMLGLMLLILRSVFVESHTPNQTNDAQEHWTLKEYLPKICRNIFLGAANGSLTYVLFGFSIIFFSKYVGFSQAQAFSLNLVGMGTFFAFSIILGHVYDLMGKRSFINSGVLFALISLPIIVICLASGRLDLSYLGIILWGVLAGGVAGAGHAVLQQGIPAFIRYRLVALSFSLGIGCAGGFTPTIMTYMIEQHTFYQALALWPIFLLTGFYICDAYSERRQPHVQKLELATV